MKSALKIMDAKLTQLVLRMPESWNGFFLAVTHLGDPIVVISVGGTVAAAGLWQQNLRLMSSGVVVWVTLSVGAMLKLAFARARPMSDYAANMRVDTFSFPSGHSSGSMIAFGLLAYIAIKTLPQPYGIIAAVLCGIIIFLVGISRIYLGAHFPSDVLAGWLLGAIALTIIVLLIKPLA